MMENEVPEMVAVYLPEEVIREILVRLPVKSLLKFRCVSKSWLSLTSTHQFAMAQLNVSSKKNDTLIFGSNNLFTRNVVNMYTCSVSSVSELTTDLVYSVEGENPVYDELDCPFTGIDEFRWIVGSCNGLVCLSIIGNDIILWNPALKKFKKLPHSGTHFDGYSDRTSHGFGYDKVHDDYKVVEISKVNNIYQVKVYSRRSNSWKVLGNWPGGDASFWPGQFLNGAIHWSVWDRGSSPNLINVVAQDVVSDEFVKLPLPNFEDSVAGVAGVKVEIIDGCVALCCGFNTHMDVWVMKEYGVGESWVKLVCIVYFLDLNYYLVQPRPLLFFGDGKILIKYGTSLRIYDSTNPQPHQLLRMNVNFAEFTVTSYFESLVSPNLDEPDVSSSTARFTQIAAIQEISCGSSHWMDSG